VRGNDIFSLKKRRRERVELIYSISDKNDKI